MTEGGEIPHITNLEPVGQKHELADPKFLEGLSMKVEPRKQMVPLFQYLDKIHGKPRGQEGGAKDLNSPTEQFIIKEGEEIKLKNLSELQDMLRLGGFNADILGVQSVGQKNQMVTAVVQDVDPANPQSGYERPVVAEGPHMIIAPYAYDKEGNLHVFRTVQFRTGKASIDTARGFLDADTLASGQHIYKVEGSEEKVKENLGKIIKEEGGDKFLKIKGVNFMGAHVVNRSFVTSPSALFGVEVDFDTFSQLKNVVSPEEAARRKEQFEHEGIMDIILDMTPEQYVNYKTNASLSKDMAADSATDIVMLSHLFKELQKVKDEKAKPVPAAHTAPLQKTEHKGNKFLNFFRKKAA